MTPQAAGSGLPEVIETLRGMVVVDSLTWRVVRVKALALALALASGLSSGKEGPIIHICCAIAQELYHTRWLPLYRRRRETERSDMLSAAAALGVVLTFGAPIGGVLFGVEITSTFFKLKHLPRTAFTATVALLIVQQLLRPVAILLGSDPFTLFATDFEEVRFGMLANLLFAAQGVACACISNIYVRCVHKATQLRHYQQSAFGALALSSSVAILCCVTELLYSADDCSAGLGTDIALTRLFSNMPLAVPPLVIFGYGAVRLLILTPLSLCLTVPTGTFLPLFVGGAAISRGLSEWLLDMVPTQTLPTLPLASHFAVAGAAAMSAAGTGTISPCVIVMELTGQLSINLPLLITVISAFLASKMMRIPTVFDIFTHVKLLPSDRLREDPQRKQAMLEQSIWNALGSRLLTHCLPRQVEARRLSRFVAEEAESLQAQGIGVVPIVRSLADPVLVACVSVVSHDLLAVEAANAERGHAHALAMANVGSNASTTGSSKASSNANSKATAQSQRQGRTPSFCAALGRISSKMKKTKKTFGDAGDLTQSLLTRDAPADTYPKHKDTSSTESAAAGPNADSSAASDDVGELSEEASECKIPLRRSGLQRHEQHVSSADKASHGCADGSSADANTGAEALENGDGGFECADTCGGVQFGGGGSGDAGGDEGPGADGDGEGIGSSQRSKAHGVAHVEGRRGAEQGLERDDSWVGASQAPRGQPTNLPVSSVPALHDMIYDEHKVLRNGVDLSPISISMHMQLDRVLLLFQMLGLSCACIVDEGVYLGLLTRMDLFRLRADQAPAARTKSFSQWSEANLHSRR